MKKIKIVFVSILLVVAFLVGCAPDQKIYNDPKETDRSANDGMITTFYDGRGPVHFSSSTDDVSFYGTGFRMDCEWPSGIIHIWNSHEQGKGFNVRGHSSMMFEEVRK